MAVTMSGARTGADTVMGDDAHALFVARVLLRAVRHHRGEDDVAAARTLGYLFRECTTCQPSTVARFCTWLDDVPRTGGHAARALASGVS
ncbi:hypothetical protein [Amycolatopsis silviterrae]|uniref:Uncharacterized protein n=1 Tax=Amycolatopsis silviterrae TaxID=1656914 RepID=A0ABW5HE75_9PSEU